MFVISKEMKQRGYSSVFLLMDRYFGAIAVIFLFHDVFFKLLAEIFKKFSTVS
jgi:hypothetical protein